MPWYFHCWLWTRNYRLGKHNTYINSSSLKSTFPLDNSSNCFSAVSLIFFKRMFAISEFSRLSSDTRYLLRKIGGYYYYIFWLLNSCHILSEKPVPFWHGQFHTNAWMVWRLFSMILHHPTLWKCFSEKINLSSFIQNIRPMIKFPS